MLAAAWIQFMTRDWFSHGSGDKNNTWQVPLPRGDDFPQNPMLIPRTIADPTRPPDDRSAPPTHVNLETPWWDALADLSHRSSSCRLACAPAAAASCGWSQQGGEERLPPPLLDQLAQVPGWWLGLGLLLTLFAREHNAICDRLAAEYPNWTDEQLFQKARLINAALLAKIHTVEWTPAIIAHPTTVLRDARQLVGRRRRDAPSAAAAASRTTRSSAAFRARQVEPPLRAVLADRGVRRRLPHAPADPRRVQLPPRRPTTA